jgi:hypothetical protein
MKEEEVYRVSFDNRTYCSVEMGMDETMKKSFHNKGF